MRVVSALGILASCVIMWPASSTAATVRVTPEARQALARAAEDPSFPNWQRELMQEWARPPEAMVGTSSDDGTWSPVFTPTSPLSSISVINDPVREQLVVFGGTDGTGLPTNRLWTVRLAGGPLWTLLQTNGTAPRRSGHTALYDPVRDRMVVFGGYDGVYSCRHVRSRA